MSKGGKNGGWGRERPPLPFLENQKKCPDLGEKAPKCLPAGPFSLCFCRKVYRSTLIPQNLPCPEKILVALLDKHFFFCLICKSYPEFCQISMIGASFRTL